MVVAHAVLRASWRPHTGDDLLRSGLARRTQCEARMASSARLPLHPSSSAQVRFQSSSSSASTTGSSVGSGCYRSDGDGGSAPGGPTGEEQGVIDAAEPTSDVMEERLGFRAGETVNEEKLKERFLILAKWYHPDSASAPPDSADAFPRIKEAYDVLLKEVKGGRTRTSHSGDGLGDGPRYADEAQRRARMRALGDGVMFFILATIAYIVVVATHNRERLKSRYLLHFVGIFFIIQLFPRLLAAAVLFALHTGYLIRNGELREQAAALLLIDQRGKDLYVRVEGVQPECMLHTVVQVEIVVEPEPEPCADDAKTKPPSPASEAPVVVSRTSTTLTLDAGVTSFSLPLPPKGAERRTCYRVKAVDQHRKFVLLEKQFTLA